MSRAMLRRVKPSPSTYEWVEWRRDAPDRDRAVFQAKRAYEYIEVWRYLSAYPGWHHAHDIAAAVGIVADKGRGTYTPRQVRRVLGVLEVAGYIEVCVLPATGFGAKRGTYGTMARIKVERPEPSRSNHATPLGRKSKSSSKKEG